MQYLWPYNGSFRHHNLYPPPFKSCIRLWFWAVESNFSFVSFSFRDIEVLNRFFLNAYSR